jgi:hypothetical protein
MPARDIKDDAGPSVSAEEALEIHAMGRPGKLEITPTKPMATQRYLSLAYSRGVAVPVKAIALAACLAGLGLHLVLLLSRWKAFYLVPLALFA